MVGQRSSEPGAEAASAIMTVAARSVAANPVTVITHQLGRAAIHIPSPRFMRHTDRANRRRRYPVRPESVQVG